MKTTHAFWTDPMVPFVELRFTRHSGESYKEHCHRQFCIGAVTEGVVSTTIRDRRYLAAPGSLILIAPEEVHSCNPHEGCLRSYAMAFFDLPWCTSIQDALFGESEEFISPNTGLLQSEPFYQALLALADLLPGDALPLEKTEALTQFVADLFLAVCDSPIAPTEKRQGDLVQAVKSYLREQSELKITLGELSEVFGCNPYHLLRTFRKAVGIPPHAYLLNARIEKAKELLLNGAGIADVAAETGFADQSHFHKTFRRIVAATPAQYQKRSEP